MKIRIYSHRDADAVITLWNRCLGQSFPLDRRLFVQNTRDCPHFKDEGAFVMVEGKSVLGYIGCKMAREPIGSSGLLPERGWISILLVDPDSRRKGVGSQLLARAEAWLQGREIILGGDPSHFFPGIPVQCDAAAAFFSASGYAVGPGRAHDLRSDLTDYRLPESVEEVEEKAGVRIVPCSVDRSAALDAFLAESFSGRWRYDTRRRIFREGSPRDIIVAVTEEGVVVGFSSTFHPISAMLGPSVYWRDMLGPAYCGLGPIGVAESMRGRGLGMALVQRSMEYVRSRGGRQMGVDWTILLDFYAKAGFTPWNEYLLSSRPKPE